MTDPNQQNHPEYHFPPFSLITLNHEVQQIFPHVEVKKGDKYFYIYSTDELTAAKIKCLYTPTIYITALRHISIHNWLKQVETLMKNAEEYYLKSKKVKV